MRTVTASFGPAIAKAELPVISDHFPEVVVNGFAEAAEVCHVISVARGWWSLANGKPYPRNVGELICLMHSELSEAMEAARKDLPAEHIGGVEGVRFTALEEELADLLVRVFDFAGGANLRLAEAFKAKCLYNIKREDHSHQARAAAGGKQF